VEDDAFAVGDPLLAGDAVRVFGGDVGGDDAALAGLAILSADVAGFAVGYAGAVIEDAAAVGAFWADVEVTVDGVAIVVGRDRRDAYVAFPRCEFSLAGAPPSGTCC
jgi:hypothetical protein